MPSKIKLPLKVIELFAGVGGFRLGLKKPHFQIVWSNQWEPATRIQHASDIYVNRFGKDNHSNKDIAKVDIKNEIPIHDLLVGGFPCQDYSVAKPLKDAVGISGKKGVLWWEIYRILSEIKIKPQFLLLENVDRLLKSVANQRGRDFAIMLASLSDLGYAVEWRVINAADYGFPQRRRRIFFLGYHKTSKIYNRLLKCDDLSNWIFNEGVIASAFPVVQESRLFYPGFPIKGDLVEVTEHFNSEKPSKSPFENSGVMLNRKVLTMRTKPFYEGKRINLGDILLPDSKIPEDYYIKKEDIPKWEYLKGAKHLLKKSNRTGKTFKYDEGSMKFPDDLDKPSRTIVTGEGGSAPSRFKHAVRSKDGRLRRLTPIELERLNMFPDDHTKDAPPVRRAFFMGNALVVGVVKRLGEGLIKAIKK